MFGLERVYENDFGTFGDGRKFEEKIVTYSLKSLIWESILEVSGDIKYWGEWRSYR